jgi:hypothetical protein
MNLIANTEFIFMLVFTFLIIILRTDMRIDLILTDSLQCDRVDHIFGFVVPQEIFVRISISTNDFEEIQKFFDRLMLNDSDFAKYENSSLVRTKKFMNEDDIIVECVFEVLNDHFESKIFSFADSLLDFDFDEEDF